MTRENIGSSRASSRVIYVTLFGMLFFGLALMAALLSNATSASRPPSRTDNPTSPNELCWQVVPSPNQGTSENALNAAVAVSLNDMWAVGYYDYYGLTLVEHWNGTAWSVVSSPNSGRDGNFLNGIAAVSTSDVWAVGYYSDLGSTSQTR